MPVFRLGIVDSRLVDSLAFASRRGVSSLIDLFDASQGKEHLCSDSIVGFLS